jgi:hypothetical protein
VVIAIKQMIELFLFLAQTPPPQCHPSYPDLCLPIGRDVDCSDIPDSKKPVRIKGKDMMLPIVWTKNRESEESEWG